MRIDRENESVTERPNWTHRHSDPQFETPAHKSFKSTATIKSQMSENVLHLLSLDLLMVFILLHIYLLRSLWVKSSFYWVPLVVLLCFCFRPVNQFGKFYSCWQSLSVFLFLHHTDVKFGSLTKDCKSFSYYLSFQIQGKDNPFITAGQ